MYRNLPPSKMHSRSGIALVLVLALLVLVSALVLAVFQSVQTETASSTAYERGTSTRMLADTAVNLVIGQIQEATQRPGEAWVSQPGLIRTFDTSGNPTRAYKLYSTSSLTINGTFNPADGGDLPPDPTTWKNSPNEWVDLNRPVVTTQTDTNGDLLESFVFPVVDPRAYNPTAPADSSVEGFAYETAWASETTAPQSLAMPVRWLYLLEDGTLVPGVPTGEGDTVSIDRMTADNPAIARLAFWTDDESSKVNINTAGDGAYWDTPVGSIFPSAASGTGYIPDPFQDNWEFDMAVFQPAKTEYQRYPGHPATTSLMPIIGNSIAQAKDFNRPFTLEQRLEILSDLFAITPRYVGGESWDQFSSRGGHRQPVANDESKLVLNNNRLFANVDELLFSTGVTETVREENPIMHAPERRPFLGKLPFFLTATSSSPEINQFNKPRVVAWPVWADVRADDRTAFDKLAIFCGTVGGIPYNFTRVNAQSPTDDWNITRNQQLYTYLTNLTNKSIPGAGGGSLAAKYGTPERDQILTQIMDYIRTTNLAELPHPYVATDDSVERGQVVPLDPGNDTRGFGRFATVSELTFHIIQRPAPRSPPLPYHLDIAVYPELFSPMAGYSAYIPNMVVKFENLDTITVTVGGTTYKPFAGKPTSEITIKGKSTYSFSANYGGYMGPEPFLRQARGAQKGVMPFVEAFATSTARFAGNTTLNTGTVKVSIGTPAFPNLQTLSFPSETITVKTPTANDPKFADGTNARLLAATGNNPHALVHSAKRDFVYSLLPSAQNVLGDLRLMAVTPNVTNAFEGFPQNLLIKDSSGGAIGHTLRYSYGQSPRWPRYGNLVKGVFGYDSVRGVPGYDPVIEDWQWEQTPPFSTSPDLPPQIDGVYSAGSPMIAGDWDNGPGLILDGPLINKPDEGTGKSGKKITLGQSLGNDVEVFYIGGSQELAADKIELVKEVYATPNRQIPSPVMLGSLPTGVKRGLPWRTLHFRPSWLIPAGLSSTTSSLNLPSHPGSASTASPADHHWLDLFWMPVVEPYAISQAFCTAGKVNLNYQIAPFNYIDRSAGLRAVLYGSRLTALNPTADSIRNGSVQADLVRQYKRGYLGSSANSGAQGDKVRTRIRLDLDRTLSFFNDRFKNNKPFISASEICDMPLVPHDASTASVSNTKDILNDVVSFWSNHKLTGDNSLERPYAHIYPRVTTKSNTYTVHVRAQRLKVSRLGLRVGEFGSGRGEVTGEFIGSFSIERFLDPNSDSLVKDNGSGTLIPASENDPDAFLGPYKFRVLNTRQLSL